MSHKIVFYETTPGANDLRPNKSTRDWMDNTSESFAYRCLPLNVANAHGWSFYLKHNISFLWTGGKEKHAIQFRTKSNIDVFTIASSVFGHGIVTFFIKGIFRTEPGWDLFISGPPNQPKDGIAPLQGVVETDWAPYSFTMNWQMTRPNTWVHFEAGESFCSVMPVPHGYLQKIDPYIVPISVNPTLQAEHAEWATGRQKFIKDLGVPDSEARQAKWQKNYYQGKTVDGESGSEDHIIKLRLKEFSRQKEDPFKK